MSQTVRTIAINGRLIGDGHPCYIIAEACDNHLGDLNRAKEMALHAKLCGADAVKFQHHIPDEEMLPDVPTSSNFNMPLYEFLKRYALSIDQHRELKQYCDEIGITYLCTPFSKKAALEINDLVPAFKIGSGELTDIPTLEVIAELGKPMIISTGMATWEEIEETVQTVSVKTTELILMNCLSEYPARYEDVNLGVIRQLKAKFGVPVGHSDHTPDIYTCFGAVAVGANLLEKHIILDRRQEGPDQSVSIEPYELYQLVKGVRAIEAAMGNEKKVHDLEKPIRQWARRSIVTLRPIPKGTILTEKDIWTKRPGTGVPAKYLKQFIGKKTKHDLPANHMIRWDDIE